MKTICMILLSTLLASACHASPESPGTGPGNSTPEPVSSAEATDGVVTIRFDEIATYPALELRWLDIRDSRCPTGVNCVHAGDVKVILEATNVMDKGNKPVELELSLYARGQAKTAFAFGYELELLSVHPYPKDQVTSERNSYVAEIKISKAMLK